MQRAIGAVALTALLAMSACASREARTHPPAGDASNPPAGVVAWVDRPAPAYVEPTPTPTNYPTDAPPCHASDLTASAGDVGAAGGTTNIRIDFSNSSATPCVLLGQPTVSGVSDDGTVTDLDARLGSIIGDAPWPAANIAPGETAAANVSASDACDAAQQGESRVYPTLRIGLPTGDDVDVPSHGFDTVCGVVASRFGVPALEQPPQEPQSPLVAHMDAPATASAGEDFTFTVTLRNRSDSDYPLTPCPAYEEYLGTPDGIFVHPNYYLNCDTVTDIPVGVDVTYEMRIHIPADAKPTEFAKFGWQLQGDAGPIAVTTLEITY